MSDTIFISAISACVAAGVSGLFQLANAYFTNRSSERRAVIEFAVKAAIACWEDDKSFMPRGSLIPLDVRIAQFVRMEKSIRRRGLDAVLADLRKSRLRTEKENHQ